MKRIPVIVALAGLVLLLWVAPAGAAGPSFTGGWTGNDPAPPDGDGSTLFLTVSGSSTVHVTFIDRFGSVCLNHGARSTVFVSQLSGTVTGNDLEATFRSARCGSTVIEFLEGESMTYVYDPETDTLSDGSVTFHRHEH